MKHQLTPPIHAGPAWQYHFLNLSVADVIVVALMVIVFALAVLLPFPGHKQQLNTQPDDRQPGQIDGSSNNGVHNGGDLS